MSFNDRSVLHKQPKPGYFRQIRNPGQDVSPENGTSGHLTLKEDFINSDIVNKSELGIRTCSVNAACKSWSQEHNRFHCDMGNVKCENLVIIYYALCARRFGRALCLHLMSFPASCAQHHVPKSERFLKIPRSGLFFIIPLPLFLHLHLHLCI